MMLLLCLFSAFSGTALAEDSWQTDVSWAMADTGPTDCDAAYTQLGVGACVGNGNRACVMEHAIQAAEEGKCQRAFRLTSMTNAIMRPRGHDYSPQASKPSASTSGTKSTHLTELSMRCARYTAGRASSSRGWGPPHLIGPYAANPSVRSVRGCQCGCRGVLRCRRSVPAHNRSGRPNR